MKSGVVLLLLAAVVPAAASDEWIRVSTAHFDVYTTAGEKSGRETALQFERVRGFFERASPLKPPPDAPVRIILFSAEQQYARYAVSAVAAAFYAAGPTRDYIVLQDSPQKYAIAIHEYMHLIVRHSGLRIPVWLNEGWADVYSTLRPVRAGVAVGDLLPGRVGTLQNSPWMDLEALNSVTRSSAVYNERDRAGIFYAESWALTHMLYLAPDYKDRFGAFVTALNKGSNLAAACGTAFGKTPAQVFADLRSYLNRRKLYGVIFEARQGKDAGEPRAEKLSDFDSSLMLADLLAATGRKSDARAEYERLNRLRPGQPEIAEALGFIQMSMGDIASAREQFRKAFDAGASDARMCVVLAQMEREAGAAPGVILPILDRVLTTWPDNTDARIQLGFTRMAARDYRRAISTLVAIPTIPPAEATPVYVALTYASIETGDLNAARGYAATALKWATSAPQRTAIAQMNSLIEARTRVHAAKGEVLLRASGSAATVACSASGNKLQLISSTGRLTFDMPDMQSIELSGPRGVSTAIHCGPQNPSPVIVDYVASPVGSLSAGIVRRIALGGAQ